MKAYILSLFFWIYVLISCFFIFPFYFVFWLGSSPFDRQLRFAHCLTGCWAYSYIGINPWWHVSISGKERIDRKRTYIFICNHQSLLDILLLFKLRRHFRWVAKTEIFRIPVAGWVMLMNNYLWVKRGDKQSAAKMMQRAKKAILNGNSIMIFPEGTRTRDGNINLFKEGAFNIAIENKVNIIPIVIDGTFNALPKTGLVLKPNQMFTINVLDEIDITQYGKSDIEKLKRYSWELMSVNLQKIRKEKLMVQRDYNPSDIIR